MTMAAGWHLLGHPHSDEGFKQEVHRYVMWTGIDTYRSPQMLLEQCFVVYVH